MTKPIRKEDVEESLTKLGIMLDKKLVLKRGWEDKKKAWINQVHTKENGETNEWNFCGFYDRDMTSKELFKTFEFAQSIVEIVMRDTAKLLNKVQHRWDNEWADLDKYLRHWMRR